MTLGSRGTGLRGRSIKPSAASLERVSAIIAATAPSPIGVTSSASRTNWPLSLPQTSVPTTVTRSPATVLQRRELREGHTTGI
jgi:hypothetical protein